MPASSTGINSHPWTSTPGSSNVGAYSYDPQLRQLHVRFNSGHTYSYHDVDPSHVDGLANAGSVGQYMNQFIKGQHHYTRHG